MGINIYWQGGGYNSITYTNGELKMDENFFGLGLPYYLNGVDEAAWSTFIEPDIQAVTTGFSFIDPNGNTTSSTTKFQVGPSLNIGAQFRFYTNNDKGFSVRPQIGVFYPVSSSGAKAEMAVQGGIIFQWELFKE